MQYNLWRENTSVRLHRVITLLALLVGLLMVAAGTELRAAESESLAKGEARVTVSVTDFAGVAVSNVSVELLGVDVDLNALGQSDKNGQYVVVVPQGKTFNVTCKYDASTFKFGEKLIPKVDSPLNFALKLSINTAGKSLDKGVPPGHARVNVSVVNSLDQPEPDVQVLFEGVDVEENFEGRSDYNGEWTLTLPTGKNFAVKADKYGVLFELGTHPIPMVNVFNLNLKLIIERTTLARAAAAKQTIDGTAEERALAEVQAEEEAAQAVIVTISVLDEHNNPESDAELMLTDQVTGEVITGVTDSLGRQVVLLPGQRDYQLVVEKYGAQHDAGRVHVPSKETHNIDVRMSLASEYLQTYSLKNVYFDTAKATLRAESYVALDGLLKVLNEQPNMVIELAGHTDSRADDLYNLKLSRDRANTARDYLISRGVAPERLAAKGYGELQPVAGNESTEDRQLNRRTEVRIIKK